MRQFLKQMGIAIPLEEVDTRIPSEEVDIITTPEEVVTKAPHNNTNFKNHQKWYGKKNDN